MTSPGIARIERCLGKIQHGWSEDQVAPGSGVQIARSLSADGRFATIFTLDLARHALPSRLSGKAVHMELLIRSRAGAPIDWAPVVLADLVAQILERRDPLLRGDCVGPRGPLFPCAAVEALYCTVPVFLEEDDQNLFDLEGRKVTVAWLVPITRREAMLRQAEGWEALEDHLEGVFDQLFDPARRA